SGVTVAPSALPQLSPLVTFDTTSGDAPVSPWTATGTVGAAMGVVTAPATATDTDGSTLVKRAFNALAGSGAPRTFASDVADWPWGDVGADAPIVVEALFDVEPSPFGLAAVQRVLHVAPGQAGRLFTLDINPDSTLTLVDGGAAFVISAEPGANEVND